MGHSQALITAIRHVTPLPSDILNHPRVTVRTVDFADKNSLKTVFYNVDTVVHFAGVLFRARPERFLPTTNTIYFKNVVDSAREQGVKKIILISFPHTEGETSFNHPAEGRFDRQPISVHATTRLEEERYLAEQAVQGVVLRVGMVYGRGILMIDAARWLAKHWLLGVWRSPTQIHLISTVDFCRATQAAIENPDAHGIYHIGDEGKVTLQEFLDLACQTWGVKKPWRMPLWLIYAAARLSELASLVFGTTAPLTKDFVDIGRVSYYGDTLRMRCELIDTLVYSTVYEGKEIL